MAPIHRAAEKKCSRKLAASGVWLLLEAYIPRAASRACFASTAVSRLGLLAPHDARHSVS
jgi:hypothetical protein